MLKIEVNKGLSSTNIGLFDTEHDIDVFDNFVFQMSRVVYYFIFRYIFNATRPTLTLQKSFYSYIHILPAAFIFHSVNKRNGGILKYVRSHTSPAKRIFLQTKLCIKHARTTLSQRAHTKRVYNATAYIYMSYSICHFRQTIYIHNTCVCSLLQFQQIIFFLSYSLHVRI